MFDDHIINLLNGFAEGVSDEAVVSELVQFCGRCLIFITILFLVNSWYGRQKKAEAKLKGEISRLLAMAFNDVMLRNWSNPERHFFIRYRQSTTYEAFMKAAQSELRRPPSEIQLYFLPKDQKWQEARKKITDTETLQTALDEIRKSQYCEKMEDEDQPEIVFHISERSPELNSLVMPDRPLK